MSKKITSKVNEKKEKPEFMKATVPRSRYIIYKIAAKENEILYLTKCWKNYMGSMNKVPALSPFGVDRLSFVLEADRGVMVKYECRTNYIDQVKILPIYLSSIKAEIKDLQKEYKEQLKKEKRDAIQNIAKKAAGKLPVK